MDGIFDKILAVCLAWMVLSWKCIVCQNANLTANPERVSPGDFITLTCMYTGTGSVDAIVWFNGSNTDSFSLTPGTIVPQCDVFSTINASFDPSRLHHTCDKMRKNYTLTINPVHAIDLNVKWSCTFLDPSPNAVYSVITILPTEPTSTSAPSYQCELERGLGPGLGPGIPFVITSSVVVILLIFVYKGYTCAYILGLLLGLGLGITFHVDWMIIAGLISQGNPCKLELGLGLGLGSGIPCVIACIVAVIFVFFVYKGDEVSPEPTGVKIGKGILKGLFIASVIGIVVNLIYKKLTAESTSVNPEIKSPVQTDKKNKTKHTGPAAFYTENQGKSETTSKKTNGGSQPSPHVAVVTGGIPKPRALPTPPEDTDVKNPNQREISATSDDKQGIPTSRSNKLPPLADDSDKPKEKKKKKKKNKRGQINDGNPEGEMVVLTSKRKLPEMPEDQSDGD